MEEVLEFGYGADVVLIVATKINELFDLGKVELSIIVEAGAIQK